MAALAQSAVTFLRTWTEGGPSGKVIACRQVTLNITAQGTVANPIPASVLGLSSILYASTPQTTGNTRCAVAAPSFDGSILLLYDMNNLTDASRSAPADFAVPLTLVVKGNP